MRSGVAVSMRPTALVRFAVVVGALTAFGACSKVVPAPTIDASTDAREEEADLDVVSDTAGLDARPETAVLDAEPETAVVDVEPEAALVDVVADRGFFDAAADRAPLDAIADATSDAGDVFCTPGRVRCNVCTSLVGTFHTRLAGVYTTFRFFIDGTWTATAETDVLPAQVARGRFSLLDNRLSFWDDPLDGAPGACPAGVEGVYGLDAPYACGAFTLRLLRDDCASRARALRDAYFSF